ncbi:MAG: DUF1801 domain-containing protein [Bacteroidota bacterium]
MAGPTFINAPEKVTAHIQQLDSSIIKTVQMIRQTILDAHSEIGEHIKWNSPAFFYSGKMKPSDPKEYKRDIVVVNLHRGKILLVFPTGAIIKDTTGLLEGNYTDGRRLITFKDLKDVTAKQKALQGIIQQWIALVD